MELIDRYVEAVIQHLPKGIREESQKVIRAKIISMLSESPSEQEIRSLLENLGNPAVYADDFRHIKRYVIGPGLYPSYIIVLKWGITAAAILSFLAVIVNELIQPVTGNGILLTSAQLFANVILAIFQTIGLSFFILTIAFIVMEKRGFTGNKLSFITPKWSVDKFLKQSESNKRKISRMQIIISIAFTIIIVGIICGYPEIIGLHMNSDNLSMTIPLFMLDRLHAYNYFILILALFQIGIHIYMLFTRKWNLPLAIVNTVYNIAVCVLVCVMLTDSSLFNIAFFPSVERIVGTSLLKVMTVFRLFLNSFIVFFIAISILNSIGGFVKAVK